MEDNLQKQPAISSTSFFFWNKICNYIVTLFTIRYIFVIS